MAVAAEIHAATVRQGNGQSCRPVCPLLVGSPLIGHVPFFDNPSRTRDLDDIRALLRAQRGRLNMQEVREYFALFDRQEMLDELLAEIANDKA